ncbi:MAG TPA: hypothetical protein VGM07_05490 [Stellaceae bacterium]|jgi:hypothetical protein
MSDARDLARRYLALWEDYLTALLSDPGVGAPLWRGLAAADPSSAPLREPVAGSGSSAGAAPLSGASGECCRLMAELARRLAVVEQHIADIEHGREEAARPRRRNRRMRA